MVVVMDSSVPGSRGARLRPVWRKGMTMTIGPLRTIILVVCKKLTSLVRSLVKRASAAPRTDEVQRRGALEPSHDGRAVASRGSSASNAMGAAFSLEPVRVLGVRDASNDAEVNIVWRYPKFRRGS